MRVIFFSVPRLNRTHFIPTFILTWLFWLLFLMLSGIILGDETTAWSVIFYIITGLLWLFTSYLATRRLMDINAHITLVILIGVIALFPIWIFTWSQTIFYIQLITLVVLSIPPGSKGHNRYGAPDDNDFWYAVFRLRFKERTENIMYACTGLAIILASIWLGVSIYRNWDMFDFKGTPDHTPVIADKMDKSIVVDMPNFTCPEDYTSDAEIIKGMDQFIEAAKIQYPNITDDQVIRARIDTIVTHQCKETLLKIGFNMIDTTTSMSFLGKDFIEDGRYLDDDTKIYTIQYTSVDEYSVKLNDPKNYTKTEGLVLNFNIPGIWTKEDFTIEDVVITDESSFDDIGTIDRRFYVGDDLKSATSTIYSIGHGIDPKNHNFGIIFDRFGYIGNTVYKMVYWKGIDSTKKDLNMEAKFWEAEHMDEYIQGLQDTEIPDSMTKFIQDFK